MIGHTGQFFFGLVDLAAVALFPELGGAAAAFLSARFSLMVLADFLDAVWRGDLSVMICSCSGTEGFLTLNDTGTGLPRPWSRRADPSMRPDPWAGRGGRLGRGNVVAGEDFQGAVLPVE